MSWSGILPSPEDFRSYPEHVQDRILSWNDATILEESKRQDKLVEAKVKDGKRSSWMSFIVNVVIILTAVFAFVKTGDPASFIAFTIPGASIIGNVVVTVRKDSGK